MLYSNFRLLGEGSSASVWHAQDEDGQDVAIKRFHVSAANPATRQHWERELTHLQQLDHPQIPKYLGFYTARVEGRTLPHLVMEYISGVSLEQELATHRYTLAEITELLEELVTP